MRFFYSSQLIVLSVVTSLFISCGTQPANDLIEGPAIEVLAKDVYSSLLTQYTKINDFYGGRATIENSKGKNGLIDTKGNVLVECLYDKVWDFVDSYGLCYVSLNGAWGFYNAEFKMITKCLYDSFAIPHDGVITLSINNHSVYGAIDIIDGSVVIPFEYEDLGDFSEGLFAAEKTIKGRSLYGYIDRNNTTVLPFMYADACDFSEGLAAVQKDAKTVYTQYGPFTTHVMGFINKKGDTVIPFKFPAQMGSREFHEGLCGIGITKRTTLFGETEKNAFINTKGEVVISGLFDDADDFENGIALIKKSDKYGYINHNGEIIVPCVYDDRGYEKDKICLMKDGEAYCFNYQGELIQ